jgi:hypothetical protein
VTLSEDAKSRLRSLAGQAAERRGEMLIVARESRSQEQNRRKAERKLLELVRRALVAPRKRHATKPTRASKERRLETKAPAASATSACAAACVSTIERGPGLSIWRKKLFALVVHFLATAMLGADRRGAHLPGLVPVAVATMIGGTELFMLVVGCDLVLGPLLTLVIYNPRKKRRELIFDYSLVGTVQIA